MRINHNIAALKTYNGMEAASAASSKSMNRLSSGLRINSAADDAAGLSISEKMRGQIRGLGQASSNAQDGISLIQTAEGALNETQSILQRMRELATQASNDTNVSTDRAAIQDEFNQLTSEINRIGNTTEFNAQALLKGDGNVNLVGAGGTVTAMAGGVDGSTTQTVISLTVNAGTVSGAQLSGLADTTLTIAGQALKLDFTNNNPVKADWDVSNATANSAQINIANGFASKASGAVTATDRNNMAAAMAKAVNEMISQNSALKGNVVATAVGNTLNITAVKGTVFDGAQGAASGMMTSDGAAMNWVSGGSGFFTSGVTNGTTTAAVGASGSFTFSGLTAASLVGKGITVAGKQIEFYNAANGIYRGHADVAINLSSGIASNASGKAIVDAIIAQAHISGVTFLSGGAQGGVLHTVAVAQGKAGNDIALSDGGVQKDYQATFQVGANQGQTLQLNISDMRANALSLTGSLGTTDKNGAVFASTYTVTDGTHTVLTEASLDLSTSSNATNAIKTINDAIESVSKQRSKLGAVQNRLEHTINNLGTSSENLTAAESRIRDVDMAKEMMDMTKSNILQQASQAMLAQANQAPQGVLQLLR